MKPSNDEYTSNYSPAAIALWDATYRRALASPRGRQVLRGLRDALYALPQRRLIVLAVCTVGGPDIRAPQMSDAEAAEAAKWAHPQAFDAPRWATLPAPHRVSEHQWLTALTSDDGEGCCAIGAYAWHQLVKAGNDKDTAFLMLPTFGAAIGGSDDLAGTTALGEQHGIARTIAWELAYRNDHAYGDLTPAGRWAAFVQWINATLGDHPYPELLER